MTLPEQALAVIIDHCQPKALTALGARGQALARRWCEQQKSCELICLNASALKNGLSLPRVQDLALVTDSLESLSQSEGQAVLGQLRNYGTRQIAVLVADNSGWTLKDFIGLGFRRQAQFGAASKKLSLYTYNIDNYNHRRDWNNPRFWANPEMWGKAWW
ncbi:MAG TPA: DUF6231 family protein [Cellvibrionaceae bacterium]